MSLGNLDRAQDLGGFPLGRTPIQRLATFDDVVHRPDRLLNRCRRVRAMAIQQVHVVEIHACQRAVDRFQQVFAIEGVLLVDLDLQQKDTHDDEDEVDIC